MNSLEFETALFAMRERHYRQRAVTDLSLGFRPVGGTLGDFTIVEHQGRHHVFAIERRLQEGTPFYPGHEAYFCHASTADFSHWEVHDPVLWVQPGTWEGAHVWAPFVLPMPEWLAWRGRYVMAYTGVNHAGAQDLGLAFSADLVHWERDRRNPLRLLAGRSWAAWRQDGIASCRDPHLLVQAGRLYLTYTANTRAGASCIALASTPDLSSWEDHGPILTGTADGYEPSLTGGHPKGQIESSNLLYRQGRWLLLVQEKRRETEIRNWIYQSDRPDSFDYAAGREFWPAAYTVEVVKERGAHALLACTGTIRFGVTDWTAAWPTARFITDPEELAAWRH